MHISLSTMTPRVQHTRPFPLLLLLVLLAGGLLPAISRAAVSATSINASIVRVEIEYPDGTKVNTTGFACDLSGRTSIISSVPLAKRPKTARFRLHNAGPWNTAPSYKVSLEKDLIALEIPAGVRLPPLHARSTPAQTAEQLILGQPADHSASPISLVAETVKDGYFSVVAPLAHTAAGSPLVDPNGAVVGMLCFTAPVLGPLRAAPGSGTRTNTVLCLDGRSQFLPLFSPISSLHEAWQQFTAISAAIGSDIEAMNAFELHDYLKNLWEHQTTEKITSTVSHLLKQEALLSLIQKRHKSLAEAVAACSLRLQRHQRLLRLLPSLFAGLPADELTAELQKDERKDPLIRLDLPADQLQLLLATSLNHTSSDYNDFLYQIFYLYRVELALKIYDAGLLQNYLDCLKEAGTNGIRRPARHIDYDSLLLNDQTGEKFLRVFLQSMVPVSQPDRTNHHLPQVVRDFGGFDHTIDLMYAHLATEQLEKGDLNKALAYIQTDTRPKTSIMSLHAYLKACSGDFAGAYSHYQKAVFIAGPETDPFRLMRIPATFNRQKLYANLLDDLDSPQLTGQLRTNLQGFRDYVKDLPWVKFARAGRATNYAEIFASKEFAAFNAFEQTGVLYSLQRFTGKPEAKEAFQSAIYANPVARAAYLRLFSDISWQAR